MTIELFDGPLDGLRLERAAAPPPIVFVDARGRLFREPGGRRPTYRLVGRRAGVLRYRHDTAGVVRCEECSWWTSQRFDKCGLCHSPIRPNPVR